MCETGKRWNESWMAVVMQPAPESTRPKLEPPAPVTVARLPLGHRLDATALLRAQPSPRDTAVYVCGPEKLMSEVIAVALRLGWPKELVRFEHFGAPRHARDTPFSVVCARSGKEIAVGAKATLLEALERSGFVVPFSCRAGSCGACELPVLVGGIEHRDSVLTDEERASGKELLACVSRGKTRLVLAI